MTENEKSVLAISDMAYNSLWFLGACMQPENWDVPVSDVYAKTLGAVSGITPQIMNAGVAFLGAYGLFVLLRGASFDEFSKALTGQNKLDWTGFTWTERSKWGPNPRLTSPDADRSDHNVLGGIRNGLAHGNFEIELPPDDPKAQIVHIWSQKDANQSQVRNVRVSVTDLANFAMRFHKLYVEWQGAEKSFL